MSSKTLAWATLALLCASTAVFLGWHHPLAPLWCLVATVLVAIANARWPTLWLALAPACLPWLNFAPWSGWLMVQEFDLLLLALFAGGYARLAWDLRLQPAGLASVVPAAPRPQPDLVLLWLMVALGFSLVVGMARGLLAADSPSAGWFADYEDSLNTVRVAKSLVFGLLTVPLLGQALAQDRRAAVRQLMRGMALGLVCTASAALWERAAFPGLTDFSAIYRVTALFWEMHVGGAAIDAYLAMASPFALLLVARARSLWSRLLAMLLVVAVAYACLTTFSRGVYVAVLGPLLILAVARSLRRIASVSPASATARGGSRLLAGWPWWLLVTLVATAWFAAGPESFLSNRMSHTEKVWAGRLQHWDNAMGLLRSRTDWLWGIGLGRFPATYGRSVPGRGFSGHVEPLPGGPAQGRSVSLHGPAAGEKTAGLFALTQRVDAAALTRYRFTADLLAATPTDLVVQVCERHLLYDWACQGRLLLVPAAAGWQRASVWLDGKPFARQPWYAPRLAMFSVSVANAAGSVTMANLGLATDHGSPLLANGDFSQGLAHWFPAAQYYFVPWHADSLYLELLVERGFVGLLPAIALMVCAVVRARHLYRWDPGLALCLWASLAGIVLLGVVGSVLDVPRVAWMLYFLCFFSLSAGRNRKLTSAARLDGGMSPSVAV